MSGLEGPFGALLALGAAVVFWISAVNARDRARLLARDFCQRQGWQLLDQTVALSSLRPVRTGEGLRWQRRYRFDFSPEGTDRRRGELTLAGNRVIRVWGELEAGGRLIEPE
ncbi:MAG: DUF3301 domain-containing protein [Gammaproteobacteria bacterium]|nr:DUF3301 domain-containing protein [Gammaproteobacteria bacterium]